MIEERRPAAEAGQAARADEHVPIAVELRRRSKFDNHTGNGLCHLLGNRAGWGSGTDLPLNRDSELAEVAVADHPPELALCLACAVGDYRAYEARMGLQHVVVQLAKQRPIERGDFQSEGR